MSTSARTGTRSQLPGRKRESERGEECVRRPSACNGCREKQSRGKSASLEITSCTGKCYSHARVCLCAAGLFVRACVCVCAAAAQVHSAAGFLSWNTPLTVTATHAHRAYLLSCDELLQCFKSCLYTAGEDKTAARWQKETNPTGLLDNTGTWLHYEHNTRLGSSDSCFTVLSKSVCVMLALPFDRCLLVSSCFRAHTCCRVCLPFALMAF